MRPISLEDYPSDAPKGIKKKHIKKETEKLALRLAELQHIIYAQQKHSVLVVFQGMDASGKDGATRKVFKYCSPSAVHAFAFKKPTEEEMEHDFLWRVHKLAPRRGQIVIFNRSHYEDILIQRVHKWIDETQVKMRMQAINAFEQLLQKDNNTTIIKFYMHISPEKQREKLLERIQITSKQWKHNSGDWAQRNKWGQYMHCYEYVLNESVVPWHITPVDKRWYRDYWIVKTMVETLEKLNVELPKRTQEELEVSQELLSKLTVEQKRIKLGESDVEA